MQMTMTPSRCTSQSVGQLPPPPPPLPPPVPHGKSKQHPGVASPPHIAILSLIGCNAQASFEEGYINDSDPSVLRFLIASRQEVTSTQLRDDLLSMLVAGHETTASVLTWTLHLLAQHPQKMAKVNLFSLTI